jgi:hypothetical protein
MLKTSSATHVETFGPDSRTGVTVPPTAALRKIGAVHEGVLRRPVIRNGEILDQAVWTIPADEWIQAKATWGARVIH